MLTGNDVTADNVRAEIAAEKADYDAKRLVITTHYRARRKILERLLAALETETVE